MQFVVTLLKLALVLAGVAVLLVAGFVVAAFWASGKTAEAKAASELKRATELAIANCQIFVKERLRDPSSVEWIGSPKSTHGCTIASYVASTP